MNDNHKQPEEQPSVWIWIGVGITALILMITLNGPQIIKILIPTKAPSFSQERIQSGVQEEIIAEPTFPEEEDNSSLDYEFINDFILEDLSNRNFDAEWQQGSTELYLTATFTGDTNIYFAWAWCAIDQETLEENFDHIEILVSSNNEDMSLYLEQLDYQDNGMFCRSYDLRLIDWYPGQHILHGEIIFTEDINDGISDQIFPAATHIIEYQITVTER